MCNLWSLLDPSPATLLVKGRLHHNRPLLLFFLSIYLIYLFLSLYIILFIIKYNIKVANRMPPDHLIFFFFPNFACGTLVSRSPRPQGTKRARKTAFLGPVFVQFDHFTFYLHCRPTYTAYTFALRPFYLHTLSSRGHFTYINFLVAQKG